MSMLSSVSIKTNRRSYSGFGASVAALARREFRDALSSRWFILFTIAFAVLTIGVSFVSLSGVGSHGFSGFSKTSAGLLNLIMLIVPLMALIAGAGTIAGERERGTLVYLLSQPVSRTEVVLGKYVGLACALCCSLCLGFAVSAAVIAWRAGGVGVAAFSLLIATTCALALAMLAVGLLLSIISRRANVAVGLGLFVWLVAVFASDLGLMAGTVLFRLRVQDVFALAIVNPLQAFKMAVIVGMNASLDVLGPVGAYATQSFGSALPWMLWSVIVLWTVIPLSLGVVLFARKGSI